MVIHKARVKTPTGIVTLPPSGAAASLKFAQNDLVLPSLATGKKADVTVPAGTFKDCAVREHAEADPTGKMNATAWAHPSVPINGFVKYEGTVDGRAYARELVAYGLTGAKPKL
ncbi:MAG: hypothetical protein IPM79_02060 [Polyangiaceae bacterium]|nr:hypothetical protein [Polyangiaceae bacterium]